MGQLDTPAALFLGKEPPIPIQQELGAPRVSFGGMKSVPVVYRFEYLSL